MDQFMEATETSDAGTSQTNEENLSQPQEEGETNEHEEDDDDEEEDNDEEQDEEEEDNEEEDQEEEQESDHSCESSSQFSSLSQSSSGIQQDMTNGQPNGGINEASDNGQREVKKRKVTYEEKNIEDAVNWLSMNGGTVSDAAKRFNIPRSTLRFRLKSTDPVGQRKSGAPPALSPEEEQLVVDWVIETARMGQPPSWKRLSIAVKEMLDRSGHTKVFANNNMPSSGWLRAFKKRHPNLSPTKSDEVSMPDTLTKEDIKKWFIELQTHLKEEGLDPQTFLQLHNGNRIYNSEEVVVLLQGEDRLSKVLTQKGKRNVPKFCSPGRKMITVMTCISAAGSYLRPFIVFEGRKIPLQQLQQQVDPTLFDVGFSKRGGIDHELFSVWVEGLINYLDYHNVQRPVLLLLDSNTCHINLNTCEMAKEAGLIMHLLPPHANHLMQPVDVGIFKTLKTAYRDSVDHFMPTHGPAINKKHFPLVFVNAWHTAAVKENAINGFREAGLVPLNLEMIDTTKIPVRTRPTTSSFKAFKERAPGRPLHKGGRPPRRTPRPPGNEYIRGLSDALDHIIHNFVSDKIRPIYEQWILEEKSCTPDPVFYIWGSLKTLIEENTKKQIKCEQASQGIVTKQTTVHPPLVEPSPPSQVRYQEAKGLPKDTPPSASMAQDHNIAMPHAPVSRNQHIVPTSAIQPQQTAPPQVLSLSAMKDQTTPCLYNQRDPQQQPVPSSGYSPANMSASHASTPQPMVPWDHSLQTPPTFNRYFSTQQQHTALPGAHPTATGMGTQVPPPSSGTVDLQQQHLHRPQQNTMMPPQHAGHYYSNRTKEAPSKDLSNLQQGPPKAGGAGIKRQWLDDKEEVDGGKRQMLNVSPSQAGEKDDRSEDDGCNVYDSTDSSTYSARIGMCMQEVVPQDLCQLQYQEE